MSVRVTCVSPVGVVGGAERVLLTFLGAAKREEFGLSLRVLLLADGPLRQAIEALGYEAAVCPLPQSMASAGDTQLRRGGGKLALGFKALAMLPGAAGFLARFRRALADSRPDVVHSNGLKAHLLLRLARPRGVPVVWHLHDYYAERPLARKLLPVASAGVKFGAAISDSVRAETLAILPNLDIRTVRNAVPVEHYCPGEGDGDWLDGAAGLGPAPAVVRVGLVATYADWKGHRVFLEALAQLGPAPPVRGYLVGGPIYATAGSQVSAAQLTAWIHELGLTGRVGLVPFQRDPLAVYRALDIVAHASTRPEPFGLTIAEAMSCGRAVVVSAAGGAVELVEAEVSALTHAPGDVAGLAAQLGRLVGDAGLRARLGEAARRRAVELFEPSRFGRELAGLLREAGHPAAGPLV